jgi:hypothetical protein
MASVSLSLKAPGSAIALLQAARIRNFHLASGPSRGGRMAHTSEQLRSKDNENLPHQSSSHTWRCPQPFRQKILPLRVNSAISDIVLIDELPEGFTVKAYAADIRRQITGG